MILFPNFHGDQYDGAFVWGMTCPLSGMTVGIQIEALCGPNGITFQFSAEAYQL